MCCNVAAYWPLSSARSPVLDDLRRTCKPRWTCGTQRVPFTQDGLQTFTPKFCSQGLQLSPWLWAVMVGLPKKVQQLMRLGHHRLLLLRGEDCKLKSKYQKAKEGGKILWGNRNSVRLTWKITPTCEPCSEKESHYPQFLILKEKWLISGAPY